MLPKYLSDVFPIDELLHSCEIQHSSVRGSRGSCGVSLQPQKGLILDVQKGKSLSSTGHHLCLYHLQLRALIPCGEQTWGTNSMCTFCLSCKHFVFQLKGWGCEDSSEAITAWGPTGVFLPLHHPIRPILVEIFIADVV